MQTMDHRGCYFIKQPVVAAALAAVLAAWLLQEAGLCAALLFPAFIFFGLFLMQVLCRYFPMNRVQILQDQIYRHIPGSMMALLAAVYFFSCFWSAHHLEQAASLEQKLFTNETNANGLQVTGVGTVQRTEEKENSFLLYMKNCHVTFLQGQQADVQGIVVQLGKQEEAGKLWYGDQVTFTGDFSAFPGPRNEGEFDSRIYEHSLGMDYRCQSAGICGVQQSSDFFARAARQIRIQMKSSFQQVAGEDSGILCSIVLGDKSMLQADTRTLYQKSGIAHILAISGLHVTMLGMGLYRFLRRMRISFSFAALWSFLGIMVYGIVTGNGISTERAILMFLLAIGAQVLGRTYDGKTALSLSCLQLLLQEPQVIYNVGFLLSFGAIIGILYVNPCLMAHFPERRKQKWVHSLLRPLLSSLSVTGILLPVTLFYFYEIPAYAVLLNLIVIPLLTVLMISALLGGAAGIFSPSAGTFFVAAARKILNLYEHLCTDSLALPAGTLLVGRPSMKAIYGYYAGVSILCILLYYGADLADRIIRQIRPQRESIRQLELRYQEAACIPWVSLAGMAGMLLLSGWLVFFRPAADFYCAVLDVGQGDCIFVHTQDQKNFLFDGGSSSKSKVEQYQILPFLKANGVRQLDGIFVSHSDQDHINGIQAMLEDAEGEIPIRTLYLPDLLKADRDEAFVKMEETAKKRQIPVCYTSSGCRLLTSSVNGQAGDQTCRVRCLNPVKGKTYESANTGSAVYELRYRGFSILLTGDADEKAEQDMLNRKAVEPVTILKAGHHGSAGASSTAFLKKLHPAEAVISCGLHNRYGHPAPAMLARLQQENIVCDKTTDSGEICFRMHGDTLLTEKFVKTK